MLRITAVSAGAVEYLIRGSGCAHHEAVVDLDHGAVADAARASTGAGPVGAGQGRGDAAGYFDAAVLSGEAPGRWLGSGLAMVGSSPGQPVDVEGVRAVFGRLEHPVSGESLGRPPRRFRTYRQRLAAAAAREPLPTPERLRELELAAKTDGRKAVAYYDFTFSAVKSVSVYYAALLADGFLDEADLVVAAHRDAVAVAMSYAESHAGYVRVGYHGRTAEGRSVGRYEAATGLVMTAWDHSTNRESEPQLHTHVAVLNRAVTRSDGQIRALDGRGFRPIKEAVAAAYERALEQLLGESLGVVFATRPDGIAREILGVDPNLCAEASTRRGQVLARLDELTADYEQRHGRAPGAQARKALAQQATLDTRAAKTGRAGLAAVLAWAQQRSEAMAATVEGVADAADRVATTGHPDVADMTIGAGLAGEGDRSQVLAAAVAQVQARYATWTIGNLIAAIDHHLPADLDVAARQRPRLLEDLAKEVVAGGNGFGVVQLTAGDPVPVPAQLRRPDDGRLVFRPHLDERYTTSDQLAVETWVVAAARAVTAPAMTGHAVELLRVELRAAGLGEDQAGAVVGILSSGRAGDVLIGPAGAGKSHTVAALARAWTEQFGGRVLGLATSQRATDVLTDEGLDAVNTSVFLRRFSPDEHGIVGVRIGRGDLFIIDEASMASTRELARIIELVGRGGGKVLFTGDHHQLGAVGPGGLLELLTTDNGAFELEQIHRFTAGWEGPASARLRTGDISVLREYEDRARLHGGTVEDMQAAAVRGYLTDTLSGLESVLVVGTNAEAARLSATIREQLIAVGRVDPTPLGRLRDGALVSVGDLVQARRNDATIPVHRGGAARGRGFVTNRQTYRVRGADGAGGLRVVDADGAAADLPAGYVAAHLTLAYASTVHAAQGRTVDTAHAVLSEQAYREDAYVALTRGRERNTAYLATTRAPDSHDQERLTSTPVGRLADILDRTHNDRSAELERRAGERDGASLAWVAGMWDDVTRQLARDRYIDILRALLPAEAMDRLVVEAGFPRLLRAVREVELAGHRPEPVLAEAVGAGSGGFRGAGSVADVLRWRVRFHTRDREPDQHIDPADWTTWSPPLDGPVGQFAHDLAVLATERQAEIGQAAAVELPGWATTHLGPIPEDPAQREVWVGKAGVAGAYRELVAVPDNSVALGAAPSREQELHRTLWEHAASALGLPAGETDDVRGMSDAELVERVARWERELTWAPDYVAPQLQQAHTIAEQRRHDAIWSGLSWDRSAPPGPECDAAAARVAAARFGAARAEERARQLEILADERSRWLDSTEPLLVQAREAAAELDRRGLPVYSGALATDHAIVEEPTLAGAEDSRDVRVEPATRSGTEQLANNLISPHRGLGDEIDIPIAGTTTPAAARVTTEPKPGRTGLLDGTESIAEIHEHTRSLLAQIRQHARESDLSRTRRAAAANVQAHLGRQAEEAEHAETQRRWLDRGTDRSADTGHSHELDHELDYN